MRTEFANFLATLTARDRLFFTLTDLYNRAEDDNSRKFYQKLIQDTCLEESVPDGTLPDDSDSDSDLPKSKKKQVNMKFTKAKDPVTQKEEDILGAWDALNEADSDDESEESNESEDADESDDSDDVPPLIEEVKTSKQKSTKVLPVSDIRILAVNNPLINNPLARSTVVDRELRPEEIGLTVGQ